MKHMWKFCITFTKGKRLYLQKVNVLDYANKITKSA